MSFYQGSIGYWTVSGHWTGQSPLNLLPHLKRSQHKSLLSWTRDEFNKTSAKKVNHHHRTHWTLDRRVEEILQLVFSQQSIKFAGPPSLINRHKSPKSKLNKKKLNIKKYIVFIIYLFKLFPENKKIKDIPLCIPLPSPPHSFPPNSLRECGLKSISLARPARVLLIIIPRETLLILLLLFWLRSFQAVDSWSCPGSSAATIGQVPGIIFF